MSVGKRTQQQKISAWELRIRWKRWFGQCKVECKKIETSKRNFEEANHDSWFLSKKKSAKWRYSIFAIFRLPCQKHVIFPLFKFEIKILAKWRYFVCLISNMSFVHFSSSKLNFRSNCDIPCALSETCNFSTFQVRNWNFGPMAIFYVPYQKHVIFPLFKFETEILAQWRYSVCLIRNMSFFHFSSWKLKFWPNGDIPCALSETCHFYTFQVWNWILGQMAIFHVPHQKHVIFTLFKFET